MRDQRLDRAVSWTLTTAAGLAFGIGSWAFMGLTGEVRGLRDDLAKFSTRVAVLETSDAANRLRSLEQTNVEHSGRLADIERRMLTLETRQGK